MTTTTPTSTTFALTAGGFITQAYRMLGQLPSGGAPSADELNIGITSLNFMLKGWELDGINLWRQTVMTIATNAGQGTPDNPVSITPPITNFEVATWLENPGPNPYTRALGEIPYSTYQLYPNKLSQGSPSIIVFNRQNSASLFYLWPVPIYSGTLTLTVGRAVLDVTQASDTLDIPTWAQEAVLYNLADRLMNYQGLAAADAQTAQNISERAVAFYKKLLDFDRPTSVFMMPYGQANRNRFNR